MNMYHIGCSTDDNYIHHCLVMLCSLLENNKDLNLFIHLMYENISHENELLIKQLVRRYNTPIEFHKINGDKLDGVKFREKRPLTKAAYYRLLLSSVLKDVDRILYLDVDMVVLKSIKPLFDLNLDNYALAAVEDVIPCSENHRMSLSISYADKYFCSALMLINLEYWRDNNCEEELLKFAKKDRIVYCHDQDVLNFLFKRKWFELSPKWNKFNMVYFPKNKFRSWMDLLEYENNPCVVHFSAYNPLKKCLFIRYEKEYMYYLKLSGYQFSAYNKGAFKERLSPAIRFQFYRFLDFISLYDFYFRLKNKMNF